MSQPAPPNAANVAVLAGGDSPEAGVSRSSAAGVAKALESCGHSVASIELDAELVARLQALAPDVVFPMLHGPPGEDGTVQGLLTMLGLPFVGSDVLGCAVATDKHVAKALFRAEGLPVAEDLLIAPGSDPAGAAERIREELGSRVVVKPLRQGSALGLTPLPNGGDLTAPLREALAYGDGVLVERYVMGREITVAVLDEHGEEATALPVIEIAVADGEWYDYRNRYTPGRSEHRRPALSEDDLARLQSLALRAHRCLGLRDFSRTDFIVGEEVCVLEVNALPGMTPTSLYPDACRQAGIEFDELADRLARSAMRRGADAPPPAARGGAAPSR